MIHKETSSSSKLLPTRCVCVMSSQQVVISVKRNCCWAFQTSVLVSLSAASEVPSSSVILERRHTALHPTFKTLAHSVRLHDVSNSWTIALVRLKLDLLKDMLAFQSDWIRTKSKFFQLGLTPLENAWTGLGLLRMLNSPCGRLWAKGRPKRCRAVGTLPG